MGRTRRAGTLRLGLEVGATLAVAMLVLPLVGARWGALHARTIVEAEVHHAQRAVLAGLLDRIEVAYDASVRGTVAAAARPDLTAAVAGRDPSAAAPIVHEVRRLESFVAVRAYDAAGRLVASDPPHGDATDELATRSDLEVSPPTTGPDGVVLVVRAALQHAGDTVGHVAVDVSVAGLAGYFEDFQLGTGVDLTLVDRDGVVLASTAGPAAEGQPLQSHEARALVAEGRVGTDTYYSPRLGYEAVSTLVPSDQTWYALATTPRELALAEADRVERALWRGGLLLTGLLLVTAALVATYVGAAERRLRLAREELSDHVRSLQAANADLSTYDHIVAHDLKNPLSTIAGFASMLERTEAGALSPAGRAAVDTIGRQVTRMFEIVDGLLAYSRAGTSELRIEPVDLTAVLEDVVEQLDATIRARGAEVRVGALPTAPVDRVLLTRAMQNLVENAVQYGDPEQPRVSVLDASDDGVVRIAVRDNGEGVAPEEAGRVFEMFGRGSAGASRQGAGIGLALAHRILERHGGTVRLDPNGPGATFLVELPTTAAASEG